MWNRIHCFSSFIFLSFIYIHFCVFRYTYVCECDVHMCLQAYRNARVCVYCVMCLQMHFCMCMNVWYVHVFLSLLTYVDVMCNVFAVYWLICAHGEGKVDIRGIHPQLFLLAAYLLIASLLCVDCQTSKHGGPPHLLHLTSGVWWFYHTYIYEDLGVQTQVVSDVHQAQSQASHVLNSGEF